MAEIKRKCSECGKTKLITEYQVLGHGSTQVRAKCTKCLAKYNKDWYAKNRDRIRKRMNHYRKLHPKKPNPIHQPPTTNRGRPRKAHRDGLKQCTQCEEYKELEEFHVCRRLWDGRVSACKMCYEKRR